MNLSNLIKLLSDKGCEIAYVKRLVRNNNSKQQIYVARGDVQVLNVLPVEEFRPMLIASAKKTTFHAPCKFLWLDDDGNTFLAPNAKFILYPKYPEVRFSGFVQGCSKAPSAILNHMVEDRLLFFGVSKTGEIFGYASDQGSDISNEFLSLEGLPTVGVLSSLAIERGKIILDSRIQLLQKLKEIHLKGWIDSKQLKPGFIIAPCNERRCGGLTLEAEFGIIQNGKSEPDYLGWEIKQFGVRDLHKTNSARITLMTPEPDGGFYGKYGGSDFIKKYGYHSTIPGRMDFNGSHKVGIPNRKTGLRLEIHGFDSVANEMEATGGVYLIDGTGNEAASWSFSKMLTHWVKKHSKAVYVPSLVVESPKRQYYYSNCVILAERTDPFFFMRGLLNGTVFYDPGMHVDNIPTRAKLKPRSQFRISSKNIAALYQTIEAVDLTTIK